jgi:hypothetical protein
VSLGARCPDIPSSVMILPRIVQDFLCVLCDILCDFCGQDLFYRKARKGYRKGRKENLPATILPIEGINKAALSCCKSIV